MRIAERLRDVKLSYTHFLKEEVEQARKADPEVIDFGSGDPGFQVPGNIKEAAKKAIDEDPRRMGDPFGLVELRKAAASLYEKSYDAAYAENEVIITSGAKNALFSLSMSLFSDGDEVIIFTPCRASYPEQVKIAGAKPVFIQTRKHDRYVPNPDMLESSLTSSTKAVILNNPNNPSGMCIPFDVFKKIAILSLQKDFYIICDESFDHFIYDRPFESIAEFSRKLHDRLIIVNTTSMTYALSGWRIGFALGPSHIIDAMGRIVSHDCSQPSTVSQKAALEALKGPQDFIGAAVGSLKEKREAMCSSFERIEGISCLKPEGTFFMFPDVTGLFARLNVNSSVEVSHYLLAHAKVITVPGEVFHYPGNLRFSFAPPLEKIAEGLAMVEECLKRSV